MKIMSQYWRPFSLHSQGVRNLAMMSVMLDRGLRLPGAARVPTASLFQSLPARHVSRAAMVMSVNGTVFIP